jgi:hypothetical protein
MTIEQLAYTGDDCTMVCLVDDEMLHKFRRNEDGVTPSHVVDSFDIFKYKSGKQGMLLRPSKSELNATFGTNERDRCIEFMLYKGELPLHHGTKHTGDADPNAMGGSPRFQPNITNGSSANGSSGRAL